NARLRRIACSLYFTHTSPTQIYTLSLHDALPIFRKNDSRDGCWSFPIREYGHGRKVLSNRKTRINYWYNHVKYNLWSRVWSACRGILNPSPRVESTICAVLILYHWFAVTLAFYTERDNIRLTYGCFRSDVLCVKCSISVIEYSNAYRVSCFSHGLRHRHDVA